MFNKFKMLQSRKVSPDGFSVKQYRKGEVYENEPDSIARYFYKNEWAEQLDNGYQERQNALSNLTPLPYFEINEACE